ncbi:MAG: hypothetical protein ABIK65_02750 [Candidatus Eisenbacteria bacterium]
MRRTLIVLLAAGVCALLAVTVSGEAPPLINYQGLLTDDSGVPLTGDHALVFQLYPSSLPDAEVLWTETHDPVAVDGGVFHVILGSTAVIPADVWENLELWLGVQVDGDPEISPRTRVTSVPYSFRAEIADSASAAAADEDWVVSGPHLILGVPGSVCIGSVVPYAKLWVEGNTYTEGLDLPGTFGPDTAYVGTPGNYVGFGHGGVSEDFIGYKNNTFFFKDSPGGGDTTDADVVIGGRVGIGTDDPLEKLEVSGVVHSTSGGFKFPDGSVMTSASSGGAGDGHSLDAADGDPVDVVYVDGEGRVGVGTTAPDVMSKVHVLAGEGHEVKIGVGDGVGGLIATHGNGSSFAVVAGAGQGVYGRNNTSWNIGGLGLDFCGAYGTDPAGNIGRLGCDTAGVWGFGTGTQSPGVYGRNDAGGFCGYLGGYYYGAYARKIGTSAYGALMSGTKAVIGYNPDGDGVWGQSASGMGVYGSSTQSYGVWGQSSTSEGVHGKTWSGYGVYGEHFNTGNYGFLAGSSFAVKGNAVGSATGVQGVSSSGFGVYGVSSTGTAVYGYSTGGLAGKFTGDVEVHGRTTTDVLEITGGSDLSEQFDIRGGGSIDPRPGMVVSVDPERPGDLVVSREAYDRKVAGVISGAGGIEPGMLMGQRGSEADGANPVALTGRVYCEADASNGPIKPGDLLTTSDTPGHAMKAVDRDRSHGAVIGKAMSGLGSGRGLVLVLVNLQ